jgi:hypothetical protein
MPGRFVLSLALLGSWAGGALAQSSALDLIPANAAAAIIIRHPEELRKKGDEFLKETNLNLGLRPTEALDLIKMSLGITQGLDLEQPSGAVLLRPENARNNVGLEDLNQSLYIVLAFTDLDMMAGNFGFKKGELKRDTIAKAKNQNKDAPQFVLARGKHVYLAATEAPLERLRTAVGVSGALSAEQRRTFGSADLLVHVKPEAIGGEWAGLVEKLEAELGKALDPQEQQSIRQFVKTLESLRFAMAAIRVGEGLGINFLTAFPKDGNESVRGFLDSLRTKGSADLKGLPEGRVVAAQAYAGDSARNAVFARALVNYILKYVLEAKEITSATDRPAFAGVFNEVWQRLEGSRIGAYLTGDESKQGLFSLVAILDTQDAEKFLAEMRTLAKIADGTLDLTKKTAAPAIDIAQLVKDLSAAKYQVRASATTRLRLIGEPALSYLERAAANPPDLETSRRAQLLIREISAVAAERRKELLAKDLPRYVRPTFAFVAKAETRAGLPIDIVHIKLADKDQPAVRQMEQLFGPDWDKLRLAVYGKQVVVLLGSEVELFETALVNVKEGKAGLAESKATLGFAKMQTLRATAAFHLSVESLLGLVNGQPRRAEMPRLTSFGLAVQDAGLQLDLFMPVADIKAIVKQRMP